MAKINKDQRVLCICRNGQVRSVATRYLLSHLFGFRRVIACGWALNDDQTLNELCEWADVILVVGRASDWDLKTPKDKTINIEVGADVWGWYDHPVLIRAILPKLEALVA